jgi:hypothetical protein
MFIVLNDVDGELDAPEDGLELEPDETEELPPELLLPHAASPRAATGSAAAIRSLLTVALRSRVDMREVASFIVRPTRCGRSRPLE